MINENILKDFKKLSGLNESVEYDLSAGHLGNGITVWNRAREVNGDYQKIAHIDADRNVEYYIQNPAQEVIDYVESIANGENISVSTSQQDKKVFNEDAEQYVSLNDAIPEGKTEIWYMKPENFRDLIMGYDFSKDRVNIDKNDLSKTHIHLGNIDIDDPEEIFEKLQGESWSPNGEAKELIQSKGLQHTSMSVGDIIKINGKVMIVDNTGFKEIE